MERENCICRWRDWWISRRKRAASRKRRKKSPPKLPGWNRSSPIQTLFKKSRRRFWPSTGSAWPTGRPRRRGCKPPWRRCKVNLHHMKSFSPNPALAAAIKAARRAGQVMRDHWRRPKRVHAVEAHDVKLELDLRCQRLIDKTLRAAFPEIALQGKTGNTQFQTVLGVIYDPFTDELWTATQDGQTKLNGRAVQVSARARLEEAVIAMGFSKNQENLEKSLPHLNRLARRARKIRILGSAALELAYVASGRLDAYIERTINLWDIAAGALMVERSGGEMFLRALPDGRFRMCADNGKLRRQLRLDSLLK